MQGNLSHGSCCRTTLNILRVITCLGRLRGSEGGDTFLNNRDVGNGNIPRGCLCSLGVIGHGGLTGLRLPELEKQRVPSLMVRGQGLSCLRFHFLLMPAQMGQRIYQVPGGPSSPQEGSTWGPAGHCTQSCINTHMSSECPRVRTVLEPGTAQAEWGQHHPFQVGGRAEGNTVWLQMPSTTLNWGWVVFETVRDKDTYFILLLEPRTGRGWRGRKTMIQLTYLTQVWPWENPVHPGGLREMEKGEGEWGQVTLKPNCNRNPDL